MGLWWGLWGVALAGVQVVLPGTDLDVSLPGGRDAELEAAWELMEGGAYADAAEALAPLADALGSVDVRYLHASALYDAGQVRAAELVAARVLADAPQHLPGLVLHGLVLVDLGRGEEGSALLERALRTLAAGGDRRLAVRAGLFLGLARHDLGDVAGARAAWTSARERATSLGDAGLVAEVDAQLAQLEGRGGGDLVGQVSAALGRGRVEAARAIVASMAGRDARAQARAGIARAMIERVAGRLDPASAAASSALSVARGAGLLREEVAGLVELGRTLHLGGRRADAWVALDAALARVRGTSFRVQEGEVRVLRGRLRLLDDDAASARTELAAAEAVLASAGDPQLPLRVMELRAGVRAADGDAAAALPLLDEARAGWERLSMPVEGGRVAAEAVRLAAAAGLPVDGPRAAALRLFATAADPLGPVHVDISWGLGLARRHDDLPALDAFASAARTARALGTEGALRMARVAEDDAAAILLRIQPASQAQEEARVRGLEHALAGYQGWMDGKLAYEEGTARFKAGEYAAARAAFGRAAAAFETVGEDDNARTCRKSLALAAYNEALTLPPADGAALFEAVIGDAEAAGDTELALRARVSHAVVLGKLGDATAADHLLAAASQAEAAHQGELAGRAWASLASLRTDPVGKAEAARAAWRNRQDQVAVVAMYNAAVAAYNEGLYPLAGALLREIQPGAGAMSGDVASLLRDVEASGG